MSELISKIVLPKCTQNKLLSQRAKYDFTQATKDNDYDLTQVNMIKGKPEK